MWVYDDEKIYDIRSVTECDPSYLATFVTHHIDVKSSFSLDFSKSSFAIVSRIELYFDVFLPVDTKGDIK